MMFDLMNIKKKTNLVNSLIAAMDDKSNVSDGSHTFDELYYHRTILFSVICNIYKDLSWKSKFHEDGTMFENYFIVGIDTPDGSFTYHDHISKWELYDVVELDNAPAWDGHTSKDIVRLLSLV